VTGPGTTPRDWGSRRRELVWAVDSAAKTVNPRLRVKGSFRRRNFHLLRDGSASFSDVDLLLEADGRNRHAWERDVEVALARLGWRLRISVQHFDSLAGMRPVDSLLLTFGELIRFFAKCSDQRFAAYLYSKTTLSILRVARPPQVERASLQSTGACSQAILARVGFHTLFSEAESRILLAPLVTLSPVITHHLELMESGDVRSAGEWFLPRLKSSAVHPWLTERLRVLVEEALP
jgi:hypothetical protein